MSISAMTDEQKYREQYDAFAKSVRKYNPKEEMRLHTIIDCSRGDIVCLRTKYIKQALYEGIKKVAWMDVDCLVRGSLIDLWDTLKPSMLRCIYRPKKRKKLRFQAAVILFGNSPKMRKFVSDWDKDVWSNPRWYKDQESLYEAWKKHPEIKLKPLEEKYNDSEFKKDSIIWHSKEHHFLEKKFQKEYKKYL